MIFFLLQSVHDDLSRLISGLGFFLLNPFLTCLELNSTILTTDLEMNVTSRVLHTAFKNINTDLYGGVVSLNHSMLND